MTKPPHKNQLGSKVSCSHISLVSLFAKNQLIYYFLLKIFSWIFLVHTKLQMQKQQAIMLRYVRFINYYCSNLNLQFTSFSSSVLEQQVLYYTFLKSRCSTAFKAVLMRSSRINQLGFVILNSGFHQDSASYFPQMQGKAHPACQLLFAHRPCCILSFQLKSCSALLFSSEEKKKIKIKQFGNITY